MTAARPPRRGHEGVEQPPVLAGLGVPLHREPEAGAGSSIASSVPSACQADWPVGRALQRLGPHRLVVVGRHVERLGAQQLGEPGALDGVAWCEVYSPGLGSARRGRRRRAGAGRGRRRPRRPSPACPGRCRAPAGRARPRPWRGRAPRRRGRAAAPARSGAAGVVPARLDVGAAGDDQAVEPLEHGRRDRRRPRPAAAAARRPPRRPARGASTYRCGSDRAALARATASGRRPRRSRRRR